MTLPSYSVVVATRYRPSLLRRCLEAVQDQVAAPSDVLVVDNSDGDAATRRVASDLGARYLLERQVGLSRARNLGARSTDAELVFFIDDDAVPAPGWATRLAAAFDRPEVGAVTGQILLLASDERDGGPPPIFGAAERFLIDRRSAQWFERLTFGGAGKGGNMGFRRSLFDAGLAFNVRSGRGAAVTGGEEHLAFLSVVRMGYALVHEPRAAVLHPWPNDPATALRVGVRHLTALTGMMTLLLVEEPSLRGATLRYAWEALHGERRVWRPAARHIDLAVVPKTRAALALMWGPLRYLLYRASGR